MADPYAVNVHFELTTILAATDVDNPVHVVPEGTTVGHVLVLADLSGAVHDERIVCHGDHP